MDNGAADFNHGQQDDDDSGVSFATFTSILKYVALILIAPVITFFAAKTALDHTLRVTTTRGQRSSDKGHFVAGCRG